MAACFAGSLGLFGKQKFAGKAPLSRNPALGAFFCGCILLASCANEVNLRGGAVGSGNDTIQEYGGGGYGRAHNFQSSTPDIVLGDDGFSVISVKEHISYTEVVSASTEDEGKTGYLKILPLPSVLFNQTQDGTPVTWTGYTVSVTVNGRSMPAVTFQQGDTEAVVIEFIPIGSTISGTAVIQVQGAGGQDIGYTQLTAESAPATTGEGDNSILMYIQDYPVEFSMDGHEGAAPAAAEYAKSGTNGVLEPPTDCLYMDESGAMVFCGWSLSAGGAAEFPAGTAIPSASAYKGRLVLHPAYRRVAEFTAVYDSGTYRYSAMTYRDAGMPVTVLAGGLSVTVEGSSAASVQVPVGSSRSISVSGAGIAASSETFTVAIKPVHAQMQELWHCMHRGETDNDMGLVSTYTFGGTQVFHSSGGWVSSDNSWTDLTSGLNKIIKTYSNLGDSIACAANGLEEWDGSSENDGLGSGSASITLLDAINQVDGSSSTNCGVGVRTYGSKGNTENSFYFKLYED